MIYETVEQLRERVTYWQQVLRLQDWDVTIEFQRMRNFEVDGRAAETTVSLCNKYALICMLDPADYPERVVEERDNDRTIVHELLHLHTEPMNVRKGRTHDVAEEQMIESLAKGFISLERKIDALSGGADASHGADGSDGRDQGGVGAVGASAE